MSSQLSEKTQQITAVKRQSQKEVFFPPSSGNPSTAMNSGSSVIFRIQPSTIELLDSFSLKVSLTNNTGNAITLDPSWNWIQRLEIQLNGGNLVIQTIYGEDLFFGYTLFDLTQFNTLVKTNNFASTDWKAGVSLADGASLTVYIPINMTVFSQFQNRNGFWFPVLGQDVYFNFYMNQTINCVEASSLATPSVNVTDMQLIAHCSCTQNAAEYAQFSSIWGNGNTLLDGLIIQTRQEQPISAVSGSMQEILLSSLVGAQSFIWLVLRSTPVQSPGTTNYRNWRAIQQFQILDASGQPMLAGSPITDAHDRLVLGPSYYPETSLFLNDNNVYFWSWSYSPVDSIKNSAIFGYKYFTGNERLQVTPGYTGTCSMGIYGRRYCSFKITNGIVTVLNS